jgi:hypothetical protein
MADIGLDTLTSDQWSLAGLVCMQQFQWVPYKKSSLKSGFHIMGFETPG